MIRKENSPSEGETDLTRRATSYHPEGLFTSKSLPRGNDFDVNSPSGWYEVARLVKSVSPSEGEFSFRIIDLFQLPLAPNEVEADYDFLGLWGELTPYGVSSPQRPRKS